MDQKSSARCTTEEDLACVELNFNAIKDSSHIQIKYAKMLEELDNDSSEDLEHPVNCYPMQMNSVTKGEKSPCLAEGKHQKKLSSQFEQKRFYEMELDTLKTELESFAKQEE
jgi:hypothetical protein